MSRMCVSLAALIGLVLAPATRAEVVFSNLNSSSSAAVGSGFNYFAQRFTTISAGTGLQVDLNVVSPLGSLTYSVELWSANLAGTNVDAQLAVIGSGTTSSTDKTAITSFTKAQSLAAATDYFVLVSTTSGALGLPLGPAGAAALGSVTRYGTFIPPVSTAAEALGMQVTVATVPEPATAGLAAIAGAVHAAHARSRRRRPRSRCEPGYRSVVA